MEIDFRQLLVALRQRVWLILACAIASLLFAGAYLHSAPRVYQAQTVIEVQEDENSVAIKDVNSDEESSRYLEKPEALKTIEFNLSARELLRRLLNSEKITASDLGLSEGTYREESLVNALGSCISVHLIRGTRLIAIDVQNKNAELTARIANALVRDYVQANFDRRSALTSQSNEFLLQEAAQLKGRLEQSEQALQSYKEKTQAVSLEESQNIIVAQLQKLNVKVTEARTERLALEVARSEVTEPANKTLEQLLTVSAIANSPRVLDQRKQVAGMEAEIASLSGRYLDLNPKLIETKRVLAQAKATLRDAAINAASSLPGLYEAARETELKYQMALRDQEDKALDLNRLSIKYNSLLRDVEADRALFDAVLIALKKTAITKGIASGLIQVVQPATVPLKPVKPRKRAILAGALVGGLLLGTLISLILRAFDSSFHTVDQVEAYLESPVVSALPSVNNHLASVNRMPKGRNRHTLFDKFSRLQATLFSAALFCIRNRPGIQPVTGEIVIQAQAQHQVAEAFRKLRTVLTLREKMVKSLLFISAIPNEGKSFCAINYAISVARLGEPVLLIDTDLLRPAIEEVFLGKGSPRTGLADVLMGTTPLSDAVQKTAIENLFILTAGTQTFEPSKLLFTSAFENCLREASLRYNQVIIDSPPVHAASDSLLIAKQVDAAYMVIKARKTPRKVVLRAWQLLAETGVAIAGIVLNQMPEAGELYYHGSYGNHEPATRGLFVPDNPIHALAG